MKTKTSFKSKTRIPTSTRYGSTNWENTDTAQTEIFRQVYEILDQAKLITNRQQFNTVVSGCMKVFNLLAKLEAPNSTENKEDIREIIIHKGFSILLRLLAPNITAYDASTLARPWLQRHYFIRRLA